MTELSQANNKEFLKELKLRITKNKLDKEELFKSLESNEIITEYEVADLSKLTKEDWKKAYQTLEKDKNYQEEVKLWDSIDDKEEN
ncbi:MAG: hypothetical protein MRECE_1c082 [Mycoplasmataceae bacterium CE_OT135]|nr:MAG: hypothetical protein MRECE_1c082 [Mycoplasmataceae bacterium CE_OT135]